MKWVCLTFILMQFSTAYANSGTQFLIFGMNNIAVLKIRKQNLDRPTELSSHGQRTNSLHEGATNQPWFTNNTIKFGTAFEIPTDSSQNNKFFLAYWTTKCLPYSKLLYIRKLSNRDTGQNNKFFLAYWTTKCLPYSKWLYIRKLSNRDTGQNNKFFLAYWTTKSLPYSKWLYTRKLSNRWKFLRALKIYNVTLGACKVRLNGCATG